MQRRIVSIIAILTFAFAANAQSFISAKDAAEKMKDKSYIFVDARPKAEYGKVHIRNAVNLDVKELSTTAPVDGMMKPPAQMARTIGMKGISADTKVIAYCNKGNSAGRLALILNHLGMDEVYLLDGSLDAWKDARQPITRNPSMTKKATFTPKVDGSMISDMAEVKSAISSGASMLVDVRTPDYYNGTNASSKGHIPGAVSLDSELLKNESGLLKSEADIIKILNSKGITKDKNVILYCQSGTRAGFVYAVLAGEMGYSKLKVYDGSYNEWSATASNKIEK